MVNLVFALIAVTLAAAGAWAAYAFQRRARENLRTLADRLGLNLVSRKVAWIGTEHSVEGELQGKRVRFWAYTTGSGKSRQHWVEVAVAPRRPVALEFRIEPQGFRTSLAAFLGAKEIEVGDPAFDRAWFIRTNAPDAFAAALLPEIRDQLTAARAAGAQAAFRLDGGWVRYAEGGGFAERKRLTRLESLLPLLLDLADVAEACGGP